jgi:hypothetical protein
MESPGSRILSISTELTVRCVGTITVRTPVDPTSAPAIISEWTDLQGLLGASDPTTCARGSADASVRRRGTETHAAAT